MFIKFLRLFVFSLLVSLLVTSLVQRYQRLPEDRKRFYTNLVRQAPELPGRYFA
jgi:hypothetical protein